VIPLHRPHVKKPSARDLNFDIGFPGDGGRSRSEGWATPTPIWRPTILALSGNGASPSAPSRATTKKQNLQASA